VEETDNAPLRGVAGVLATSDPDAQWTKAAVAERLLGLESGDRRIGRFSVVRLVGAGGMGRVFLAYDEELDRRVAVKLLRAGYGQPAEARFLREARALARISHRNVVQVYEAGMHRGEPFIAMEYLEGQTLRAWQESPGRRAQDVLEAYRNAASGLDTVHREGLVHRDFKPENVFVESKNGEAHVRVIDFGLARDGRGGKTPQPEADVAAESVTITREGALVGTPKYMAPEQLAGRGASAASDQFAFCVALAEALWGEHPFPADSVKALKDAHRRGPKLPKGGVEVGWVRPIVSRGMALAPEDRYPSMADVLTALSRDREVRRRRVAVLALGGLALVAGGVTGGWRFGATPPCTGAEEALAGDWSAAQRTQLAEALQGVDQPHAVDTAVRVQQAFDGFAADWKAQHEDACLAANVRREQSFETMDRRMACMDRIRRRFGTTVTMFTSQPSALLDFADDVVAAMPDPSECADFGTLGIPAPSARHEEVVEQTRRLVTESESLRLAGRGGAALDKAQQAHTHIEHIGYAPTYVEALLVLGQAQDDMGQLEVARETLREADAVATKHGLRGLERRVVAERYTLAAAESRFEAADALESRLRGLSEGEGAEADFGIRRAEALHLRGQSAQAVEGFRRELVALSDADRLAAARVREGLAAALAAEADFEAAEAQARKVVEILTSELGAPHPRTAGAVGQLADVLRQAGDLDAAETEARRALQMVLKVRPAGHIEVADARRTLGSLLFSVGKNDEGLELLVQAARETEAALGRHADTAAAFNNLASTLIAAGQVEDGLAALRKSFDIKLETLGPQHPSTLRTQDNIASILRQKGQFDLAEREHRAAYRGRVAAFGDVHPEVAISLSNLGALYQFRGELERAEEHYRKATEVAVASEGPEHPNAAHYMVNRGNMLVELGRASEAVPVLRRALRIRTQHLAEGSSYLLDTHNALGRALCRSGARREGRAAFEASLGAGTPDSAVPSVRYDAAYELAKCFLQDGDRRSADGASRTALTWADKDAAAGPEVRARIEAWRSKHRLPRL
jgi:tetratricopeptide (TPR) repeat protein/predicted Ser/Thr protein kinase